MTVETQQRKWPKFVLACAVVAIAYCATTVVIAYRKSDRKESYEVVPLPEQGDISEIGYVYDVRDEIDFRNREREVRWWVKIPATNQLYSCSWEAGYAGFLKNDAVTLVHKRDEIDTDDHYGFMVGLHGEKKGRTAQVWAENTEDLLPPDPSDLP